MFPPDLIARAAGLLDQCRVSGLKIATAESCTGGLVAGLLTEIPGSSAVVERGFVVYSNEAKEGLLDVPAATIHTHGAVSEATARAMAEGALGASLADIAVSVTGVAGPDGGTAEKPVGLVWFASARRGAATAAREERFGDIGRGEVRLASVSVALEMLERAAGL
jgi:nicotinamide-nucleotide amidase